MALEVHCPIRIWDVERGAMVPCLSVLSPGAEPDLVRRAVIQHCLLRHPGLGARDRSLLADRLVLELLSPGSVPIVGLAVSRT